MYQGIVLGSLRGESPGPLPVPVSEPEADRGWFIVAQDLGSLPSLEETVAVANRTQRRSQLVERERTLGPATLCADAIQWFLDTLGPELRIVRHPGSFSAESKQLLTGLPCQKTVTMRLGSGGEAKTVVVTGVGDFEVGRDLTKQVAGAMGISRSAAKNRTVNPPDVDVACHCRLLPGIVSTFMPPADRHDLSWLDGVVVLTPSESSPLDASARVTISASPFESIVVSSDRFSDLVNAYHVHFHPRLTVHEFPETVTPTHPVIRARSGTKLTAGHRLCMSAS
jgi:hypothetical protein